jgi:hypothetical protein
VCVCVCVCVFVCACVCMCVCVCGGGGGGGGVCVFSCSVLSFFKQNNTFIHPTLVCTIMFFCIFRDIMKFVVLLLLLVISVNGEPDPYSMRQYSAAARAGAQIRDYPAYAQAERQAGRPYDPQAAIRALGTAART